MPGEARQTSSLALGLIGAACISVVFGLLQFYSLSEPFFPLIANAEIGQAYGNLRQRNQFATLLSMAIVAALWLHANRTGKLARYQLKTAICFLVLGLAAATSRTGLLQLALIVCICCGMSIFERKKSRQIHRAIDDFALPSPIFLASLLIIYTIFAWLLPHFQGGQTESMFARLGSGAPPGHSRLILWRNVISLIAVHPWVGWGWGELSYAHYINLYDEPRFVEILDNAHNLPLHLAVELGIPAAVLICGGFIWLMILARPWKERNSARIMAWGVLAVILLHSLLEYPLWYGPFQLIFGICLGILWSDRVITSCVSSRTRAQIKVVGGLTLIAVLGYVAWDYMRISQIYLPRAERITAYEDDTLEKIKGSWLFENQVRFAELTLKTVTSANANEMYASASQLVHFSPEPRVIVKLIESAELSGHEDEAKFHALRFKIAYPQAYAHWMAGEPVEASDR